MNELAGRNLFLVPNAIGQRLNAPPQKISDRSCFRTILRKQIVQNDYGSGQLPDLIGLLIE